MKLPKTAVIGAEGFIGRHLLSAYRQVFPDCVGTTHHQGAGDLEYFDLAESEVDQLELDRKGYKAVVISAAITGVDQCESQKELTRKVNLEGTLRAIRQLNERNIMPIFLSSDYVFDGKVGGYSDLDEQCPNTEYGRQKTAVERQMQTGGKPYLIVRLSKVFGLEKNDKTLLDEIAGRLIMGQRCRVAYDQVFSPTWVHDVVNAILMIQQHGLRGIINVCTPEVWTRYDLAKAIMETLDCPVNLLEKISLDDLDSSVKRPKRTNMVCDRLREETQFRFTTMAACLEKLKKVYKGDRSQ